jgi:hypothetical protein
MEKAEPSDRLGLDVVINSLEEMALFLPLSKGCNLHIFVTFRPWPIRGRGEGSFEDVQVRALWKLVDVLRPYAFQIWWMRLRVHITDRIIEPLQTLFAEETPRWTHLELDDSAPSATQLTKKLDLGLIPSLRSVSVSLQRTNSKIIRGSTSGLGELDLGSSSFIPRTIGSRPMIIHRRLGPNHAGAEPETEEAVVIE